MIIKLPEEPDATLITSELIASKSSIILTPSPAFSVPKLVVSKVGTASIKLITALDIFILVESFTTNIFLVISNLLVASPLYVKVPLFAVIRPAQLSRESRATFPPEITKSPWRFTLVAAAIELPDNKVKLADSLTSNSPPVVTILPFEVKP